MINVLQLLKIEAVSEKRKIRELAENYHKEITIVLDGVRKSVNF